MNELLQEKDLGNWRRTHYSKEITLSIGVDNEVVIMGWVASKRDHGNIQFIILRDMYGETQVTIKKRECSDSLFQLAKEIKEHSSIGVRGKVKPQEKIQNGVEILPTEIRVFSVARKAAPFLVQSRTSTVGIDTRLDLRAVDLRRNYLRSIFRIRQTVLSSVREFLLAQKFNEVNTPKMIATATEGGAALFPIFYYDREAFLAQSPQLYKEQLTMAFENVFEIGPIFRAEPSRTNRHLSEAISIDVECAFVNYNDVMSLLEGMISKIVDTIKEKNQGDLEYLQLKLPAMNVPFSRYRYSYIVDKLQEAGERIQWGDDFSPQVMKSIKNEHFDDFYFIIDWPTSIKPFYIKPNTEDSTVCESFDLMCGGLEVSSGSTRINHKDQLVKRMAKQGLKPEAFDSHLRVFDYGVPPHAGFGVGLERLMMALTKVENIRDATLYPRDIDRLEP